MGSSIAHYAVIVQSFPALDRRVCAVSLPAGQSLEHPVLPSEHEALDVSGFDHTPR